MGRLDRARARIAEWLDPHRRAYAPPQYRFGSLREGIAGTDNQPTPTQLLIDAVQGVQAMATRAIAHRLGDLEFQVGRVQRARGPERFVELPAHPLLELLERPSPLLTRRQLLRTLAWWIQQTGEAYLLKVTNGAGRVVELWPMSPRNVEKLSSTSSPVSGFVFHGEAGETPFRIDEVVWLFDPDPAYPFRGLGVVGPQARDIDGATFASETLRSHYQNDATPALALEADQEARPPSLVEREAFEKDWANRYHRTRGAARGVPAILPSGFSLREIVGAFDVGQGTAYLEHLRDQLLMANGVPRSILGDVVDANRAAAETNAYVFDRQTIEPLANLVADALTFQLAQPDFGPDLVVRFAEFVLENQDARIAEEAHDLTHKVRTVNEVREQRGLPRVEWGDLPIGTLADVPYTGEEPEIVDPLPPQPGEPATDAAGSDPGGDGGDEDELAGGMGARSRGDSRAAVAFSPAAEWSRVIQRERQFVPLMVSRLRRVFAAQRAMVLEALAREGTVAARSWSRADELDALFEGVDFRRLFETLVTPVRIDAAQASRQNALRLLAQPARLSFDVEATAYLERVGAELVTNVNATTKARIRRTLAKGVTDGDTLAELTARVRRVFAEASNLRARTIARTEVLQATQFGQLQGYRDSTVVAGKRWNTAQDDRVRDSHEIDGQAVQLSGSFVLGDGERAEAPGVGAGGTRLSAHNAINCRCFLTPVLEGDL